LARGWYYYEAPQTVPSSAIYYTHYGAVDSIINGLLRHLGITDLLTFYKIAAFASVLSLGFWYASASMLFNRIIAFVSLLFIGTTLSFLRLTSTIAFYPYEFLFAFGAVFLFLLAERRTKGPMGRSIAYGGAWLLVFLQASSSLEFIPWLQVFFIGYLWVSRGRFLNGWRVMLLMASAPILALVLHVFQVACALGWFHNAFIDLSFAVARRTTGFELAVETPFREFQMSQTVPFLNERLKVIARIDFIGLAILLLLNCGILLRSRRWLPNGEPKRMWAQYKLLLVFLIGAVVFFAIFIQATVTQANVVLRLLLPFLGLLIGYSMVIVVMYLVRTRERWPLKTLALAIFLVPMSSVMQFKVMDRTPFDVRWYFHPPAYFGRTTDEVRVLASFLRQNTSYGDIVLTSIDTGDTGHPYYPHPAYEYLSQRRIEVSKDVPEVVRDVKQLEGIRQSLPAANPASRVNLYLLTDEQSNGGQLGAFARYIGELKGVLDTEKWWIEEEGHMPSSQRKANFYLYKIDPAQVDTGHKKILDTPPTAPVVDMIPGSPRSDDNLVCRIIAQSTDPDGDAIGYSYAWYKDGILQPGLTTDTVDSSETEWGETWKCIVTPNDGLLDGPPGECQITIDIGKWIGLFVRIPLSSSSIEVSSFNKPDESQHSLIDGDPNTYWHVRYPPASDKHWVLIDLVTPGPVDALRVRPRQGVVTQFWDGANAVFQGSHDKEAWASLATLAVDKSALDNRNPEWLAFPVKSGMAFRYYRLLIQDSNFLSLGELEVYRSPSPTKG